MTRNDASRSLGYPGHPGQNPKRAIVDAGMSLNIPTQSLVGGVRLLTQDVLCEGWLLKKRRKKLQGYARRYFILRSSGLLMYSMEPESAIRDQIALQSAAITSTPGRKDIHVDSPRVTFHLKCLTSEDFQRWMTALRTFTAANLEATGYTFGRRSLARTAGNVMALHQANSILEDMSKTLEELCRLSTGNHSDDDDRKSTRTAHDASNGKTKEHRDNHSLLGIFKRAPTSSNHSAGKSVSPHVSHSNSIISIKQEQLFSVISRLREQHKVLQDTISTVSSLHSHPRSPIQRTIDEESSTPTAQSPLQLWTSTDRLRSSKSSIGTDTSSVWFDASEGGDEIGAEEFVLEEGEVAEDSSTTDVQAVEGGSSSSRTDDSELEVDAVLNTTGAQEGIDHGVHQVKRRTRLPAPPSGNEGSLFAILRKNVGQDLSNISFPVTFNEPLTLLQRQAEEMEYFDLLDQAAATSDWIQRMAYVAAFAVSGYACTKYRSGKKGFTPLLGETFEDVRMNFIAEKVVHKPLVIAYHASGSGWELNATSSGKTKFWGKSFEIIPTGISSLKIGIDVFEWNKPSSFTRNLMMGTKYLEHCGEMLLKNTTTGDHCVIDFKETGYWASSPNVVEGTIYSSDGNAVSQLEGKWDEAVSQKLDSNYLRVLWRVSPFPRDAAEFYGFTFFAITLNEITPEIAKKLPSTDSRFRPDVRALEEGDVAKAEDEKARLESMQRERRLAGKDVRPRWFKRKEGTDIWIYTGGYWEARKSGWKNLEPTSLF